MTPRHKPCPRCGSFNVADDYTSLVTSSLGIDRQSGAVNCCEDHCEYEGPWVDTEGDETDQVNALVWKAWDDHYEAANTLWNGAEPSEQ